MHPDHMPKNRQRDEGVEVIDRLPRAADVASRTARKRKGLAQPYQKALEGCIGLVAREIVEAADRGHTEVTMNGEAIKHLVKGLSVRRVLNDVALKLAHQGFQAHVAGGDFTWENSLVVSWRCDVPDYRRTED